MRTSVFLKQHRPSSPNPGGSNMQPGLRTMELTLYTLNTLSFLIPNLILINILKAVTLNRKSSIHWCSVFEGLVLESLEIVAPTCDPYKATVCGAGPEVMFRACGVQQWLREIAQPPSMPSTVWQTTRAHLKGNTTLRARTVEQHKPHMPIEVAQNVACLSELMYTCAYPSWRIQHVPIGTKETNVCLSKLRKTSLREIVQNQRDFSIKRSIKTEDFRPWMTHPESESLWDIPHVLPQEKESYTVLSSLWLCLSKCWSPSAVASWTQTWSGL